MNFRIVAVALLFLSLTGLSFQAPTETSISGRVTSAAGQPLVGMQVWLFRPEFDLQARKILWKPAGTVTTNDRGEYRHFGLAPGRYYLATGSLTPSMSPQVIVGLAGRRPDVTPVATETRQYGTSYYPNATEPSQARLLGISSGTELKGIDLVLRELKTFTIKARFVNDEPIPAGARVTVSSGLYYRDPVVSQGAFGSGPRIAPESQNRFEIGGVPAGRYWVTVTLGVVNGTPPTAPRVGPRTSPPTPEEETARLKEYEAYLASPAIRFIRCFTAVDVVDSDLDGVIVPCKAAAAIEGSVSVEGADGNGLAGIAAVRVSIDAPVYGIQPDAGTIPVPPMEVLPKGTFGFPMFLPWDDYRLSVTNLPEDVFVKAARVGSTDILGKSFSISGPRMDRIDILLGAKGGRIEGNTSTNAALLLVPEAQLERIDLFRTGIADGTGHFVLRGIPPGNYTLYAFERAADFFLALDRPSPVAGTRVQITEGTRAVANVPVIR